MFVDGSRLLDKESYVSNARRIDAMLREGLQLKAHRILDNAAAVSGVLDELNSGFDPPTVAYAPSEMDVLDALMEGKSAAEALSKAKAKADALKAADKAKADLEAVKKAAVDEFIASQGVAPLVK